MDTRSRIVRAAAETILEMVAADPAFADRFLRDPVGTMEPLGISCGLTIEAAAEYAEMSGHADVAGYAADGFCKYTCLVRPKSACNSTIKP